jgi:tellurite resistance protein
MPTSALTNSARAFALVALADGKISPSEEHRFARFIAGESTLKTTAQPDIRAAWNAAVKETLGAQSFGGPLVAIRTWAKQAADKELVMRAAQAALVADNKLELQENAALQSLAEALGLDPEKY